MNRREFLRSTLTGRSLLWLPREALVTPVFQTSPASVAFPVQFRKASPYESLYRHIDAGTDEFPSEKRAEEIVSHLDRMVTARALLLDASFQGGSPLPVRYDAVGAASPARPSVFVAVFEAGNTGFQEGLSEWLKSIGEIRQARFFVTRIELASDSQAHAEIRYEMSSQKPGELQYRVGRWKQTWSGNRLSRFEPIEEILATSATPLFADITEQILGDAGSFREQLLRGVPYWRARLDSACGIDVYGSNGVAAGDVDNDGWDEIYVCQPGGLPNRLYKNRAGKLEDITEHAGLAILDDTASALFVDFRNSGLQDLVVLRSSGPLFFINRGGGRFQHLPDAFQFSRPPQGTFTGMAAADYDNDGRVDVYLCCYIYFQSEDQYRYPVPYHDAQNGPPNFLFRNRLTADGGIFEDVTEATGLNHNNNRYSFAPAWCDYDGDGWPDLYVANDFGRKNLYKNRSGKFEDVAGAAGVEDIGPGMSTAWFDYDGDGRFDLYVANMWTTAGQRLIHQREFRPGTEAAAYRGHTRGNSLYHNRGDGSFDDVGASEGVEMGRWAWSADAFDFDNDGSPEIYVTCGMLTNSSSKDLMGFFWRQVVARTPLTAEPASSYENGWNALNQLIREDYSWNGREPNVYYARRGERYYDLSGVSGLDVADDSRAFAVTDLDGDGNLDLILKSRLAPQVRVFRNECAAGRNSLAFRLTGTKSNRDAIGARVEVEIDDCGLRNADCELRRTAQFVRAGSGYLSQHTKTLYFGLGEATSAAKVRVRWPSGVEQEFRNLSAGFRYEILEEQNEVKAVKFAARDPQSAIHTPQSAFRNRQSAIDNTPRLHETWLLEPLPLPEKRTGPGFICLVGSQRVSAASGLPFSIVELTREPPETAASYALFRRYLFDWRAPLELPLLFLVDSKGLAHKVYARIPGLSTLQADLTTLQAVLKNPAARQRLALPFEGRYYDLPFRRFFQLGAAFFWAGYPEQALQYLNETVRQSPANFKAHLAIGQIHLEAKRLADARQALEIARQLNSQSPEVWNNLGGVEAATENHAAAVRHYEMALSLKADLPYVCNNAAQAYVKLGDMAKAEQMFRRALELDAGDGDAANQLGLLLAKQNRQAEALKLFQQAIASRRDHGGAINNLGVLYSQMNQANDAIAAFQYGIEVAPDADNLYLNLARVYVRLQDWSKARDTLERLLRRRPNHPAALQALLELERIQ